MSGADKNTAAADNTTARPACRRPEVGNPQQAAASIRRELKIDIYPGAWAAYVGTEQQLRDEGLIPAGFEFPAGWKESAPFPLAGFEDARVRRVRLPRTGCSMDLIDNWRLSAGLPRGKRWAATNGLQEEAARLLALDKYMASPQWRLELNRHLQAQCDTAFQAAMDFKGLIPICPH